MGLYYVVFIGDKQSRKTKLLDVSWVRFLTWEISLGHVTDDAKLDDLTNREGVSRLFLHLRSRREFSVGVNFEAEGVDPWLLRWAANL